MNVNRNVLSKIYKHENDTAKQRRKTAYAHKQEVLSLLQSNDNLQHITHAIWRDK